MAVVDESSVPVANAKVVVAGKERSVYIEKSGLTDSDGKYRLIVEHAPLYVNFIRVMADEFATLHLIEPSFTIVVHQGTDTEYWRYHLKMRAASELRVFVSDRDGLPQGMHPVVVRYLGNASEPSDDPALFPTGTQTFDDTFTNPEGYATFDDLEPGWWTAFTQPWLDKTKSEQEVLFVQANQKVEVTLVTPHLARDLYASGHVVVPPDAVVSTTGTLPDFKLDRIDGIRILHSLYGGGEFVVTGQPGQELEVVVVRESTGQQSEPFQLRIGDHDLVVTPIWKTGK